MKMIDLRSIQKEIVGDTQITIKNDGYFVHWKTIQIETESERDVIAAIEAIRTLEIIGCKDF